MFKILILAYLIGQDPADTQKTFILDNNFKTMEECKQELLLNTRFNNTYDVFEMKRYNVNDTCINIFKNGIFPDIDNVIINIQTNTLLPARLCHYLQSVGLIFSVF